MQKEITDPIEQGRIVSEFAARSRQQRAGKKKKRAWIALTVLLLGITYVGLIGDEYRFSEGVHQWRIMGILFFVLWLGLLGAKLGAIEEKLDKLSDTEKK